MEWAYLVHDGVSQRGLPQRHIVALTCHLPARGVHEVLQTRQSMGVMRPQKV